MTAKKKKATKDVRITVRLDAASVYRLAWLCSATGYKTSEAIRHALWMAKNG